MQHIVKNKSKFLSYVLRHHPEEIGAALDENGFMDISIILEKTDIDLETIKNIVESNDKKRFELSEDFTKIRAAQGHSLEVDLELVPLTIEDKLFLYHGTSFDLEEVILSEGLKPRSRQYCHISADITSAKTVALRHSRNITIFKIDAKKMYNDGISLYKAKNGVYLAEYVDPKYLEVLI
jgi:putative RNA 2'-phosphotransferase